ncbi:TIGR02646 family protein [bacterium]|nr:TIGR02646 family protein [bacterium]
MLRFRKQKQPETLTQLQATPDSDWRSSREIREQLLADQGFLCAYCQRRIPCAMAESYYPGMHVEHWLAQSTDTTASMQWSNLLGVCPGEPPLEAGTPHGPNHCDRSRGHRELFLHPIEGRGADPRTHITYNHEGRIGPSAGGNADAVRRDIASLNLNHWRLRLIRRELRDFLRERLTRRGFSLATLREHYREYSPRQDQHSHPLCEVARCYLRSWARKKGASLE